MLRFAGAHLLAIIAFAGPLARAEPPPASAAKPDQAKPDQSTSKSDKKQVDCLACHGSDPTATMDLPGGEKLSVYVDPDALAKSVHGSWSCTDCHTDKGDYPHDSAPFTDRRSVTLRAAKLCRNCHSTDDVKTQNGVHEQALARGNLAAAGCVDCHGAHEVRPPREPRTRISDTCARCHQEVYATFAASVHGKALLNGNPDVPVCTDCHKAHEIPKAKGGTFALGAPEYCGKCHTDPARVAKYGLSTAVVRTYLADFHGMSATLQRGEAGAQPSDFTASCTDCHGVHDIRRTHDPDSRVFQANLVKTCRRCHPGASDDFPSAWLSHYEPSWKRASMVYMAQLFYRYMIPFMLAALVLQIGLHIYRVVVKR